MAKSQDNYIFRNYQVEKGLSHNTVFCILQSHDGFLWFGTKAGLNRFDGNTFKIYRYQETQPDGLGNNFIQCLFQDNKKNMWVGTLNGLYEFNTITEKFKLINSTKNSGIRAVQQDEYGKIWFIADYILQSFNPSNGELLRYGFPDEVNPTALLYHNQHLYVATNNGHLKLYNQKSNNFSDYSIFSGEKLPSNKWIEKLYSLSKEEIIIATSHAGAWSYNINQKKIKQILDLDRNGNHIYVRDVTRNGNELWFATESGIYIYNLAKQKIVNLKKEFNNPYSLSDNALYAIYTDAEGGIWIGSYFKGISYCYPSAIDIQNYYPTDKANTLNGSSIREIAKDKSGKLWIGTEDAGLNLFDPESQYFKSFSNIVNATNIHGLLVLDDEIWVGTFDKGIYVLDAESKNIKNHFTESSNCGLDNNFVEVIARLKSGEILVGTARGVLKYNPLKKQFINFSELPNYHHYTAILEDHFGNIWGGTLRDGLFCYDRKSKKLISFTTNKSLKNSISNDYINNIFEDDRHQIWVCTEDGLNLYNRSNSSFKVFGKDDLFASSIFYSMLQDRNGKLWASTANGISSFDRSVAEVENYNKDNGLLTNQFNYRSAYYNYTSDRMYFGSINGLNSFTSTSFKSNRFDAKVFITGLQINNKEYNLESDRVNNISYADRVILNHNQSTFSIEFSALSYKSPELTKYEYILEGANNDWTLLQSNRKVYFTNLAPGEYIFKVKAGASNSEFSPMGAELKIIILPPFYLSKLAYFLYFLLIVVIIILILRSYRRRLELKNKRQIENFENEMEKEIYHSKIEFFTHITHEIRTPLTLIKGPVEEMFKHTGNQDLLLQNLHIVDKNTERLLNLTNQLLDFRKTEKGSFQLSFIKVNICRLLQENYLRFKGAAEKKQIAFEILNVETDFFAFADSEALNKIVGNLIDNAIKYGNKKVIIALNTKLKPNFFRISVSNDGIPIAENMRHKLFEPFFRIDSNRNISGTGLGLSLASSLTKLHEGKLEIEVNDRFNSFFLDLPIHHNIEFGNENDTLYQEETVIDRKTENSTSLPQILVVDDNPEILSFLANILRQNYHIFKASSVKEALEIQKDHEINLIISDIMMPDIDGYQFCKQLKEDLETAHIPLILLTAKNTLQSKIEGLDSGADAYIEKPFSPEYLLSQISALLVNRDKIKSFYANSPSAHLKSIAFNKTDQEFLEKITDIIEMNIKNNLLDVDFIANEMNMSRPTLYRKIKAISNLSPHELISIARLKKAALLLSENNYRINEVANKTGFSSQAQFTRSFVKQFKCTPSEYINQRKTRPV